MLRLTFIIFIAFCFAACGQTNNNSSKDTLTILSKTQKMDSIYFWKIMDYAFDKAKFDRKLKEQIILDQLIKLTPEQIVEFEIIFQQMSLKANTWNNFAAQTIIEGGSSDDRFYYFRCWLISLGQKHYEETLKNPDYLASLDIPFKTKYRVGEAEFEALIPMADNAYEIVTKKDPMTDKTFPRTVAISRGLHFDSGGLMKGTEWNSNEDLKKIAPLLFKKYPDVVE
jgi:Protein of unknown function (DUF4240)